MLQQQQALCGTQRKQKRQKGEEEEDGGSRRQVHLQETAENGRAGDRNVTYNNIDIDSDHEKSSEEDKVSINSFYS